MLRTLLAAALLAAPIVAAGQTGDLPPTPSERPGTLTDGKDPNAVQKAAPPGDTGGRATENAVRASDERLADVQREVYHELVTLARYGVFDHLAFRVDRDGVTLLGRVRTGALKEDAEEAVRDVRGVETVRNEIEVLPPSVGDEELRLALFRAVYGNAGLERYAFQAMPPIHIIVEHGRVTLEGVVATALDSKLAETQARAVPRVLGVTNNLRVERRGD